MLWSHICEHFLYSSARACITLREMQLRGSNLDQFVAEAKRYLPDHFAKLGSLVVIASLLLGPGRHLFYDWTDDGYRTIFDHKPPTLTAWVDRVLAVLHQNRQPVAQQMRTGLLYSE